MTTINDDVKADDKLHSSGHHLARNSCKQNEQ